MNDNDIRWEQRYSNFKKAINKLGDVANNRSVESLSELEKEGLIQRFEYTFELAWKTLQDLLAYKGYVDIKGPKPVLEQSLKDGYLQDESGWRKMKTSRELTSHTYNNDTAQGIASDIVTVYYPLLHALNIRLQKEVKQ